MDIFLQRQVLPDILKPALNYFFSTYGFARNVEELDGTNFLGLNPNILIKDLKEAAVQTKTTILVIDQAVQSGEDSSKLVNAEGILTDDTDSDSDKNILRQMQLKSELKIAKSQEQRVNTDKPFQEEKKFNPTPTPLSYDPYNK